MTLLTKIDTETLYVRVKTANIMLKECRICPRDCRVNRFLDEKGYCGMGRDIVISSYGPHFGEEDVLVGSYGSGTIFLTGCNLGCLFCQNYEISHLKKGYTITIENFVEIMFKLERLGCHNINFVTPTHFIPQILEAVSIAKERGLSIPLVFNCGGYERLETLRLLDGIIDIYMPDVKFADINVSKRFCNAPDYFEIVKEALLEMHRQVGDLVVDRDGIAKRGLIIRHLVLPNGKAGTREIMRFIADRISKHTYVNIMDQYRPLFRARDIPQIDRLITTEEYKEAVDIAKGVGLYRGF